MTSQTWDPPSVLDSDDRPTLDAFWFITEEEVAKVGQLTEFTNLDLMLYARMVASDFSLRKVVIVTVSSGHIETMVFLESDVDC